MIARPTLIRSLAKMVATIPQLSPTHTSARIVQVLRPSGSYVEAYDPVMVLQCSSDLVTAGYRDTPNEQRFMIIETQEEGVITYHEEVLQQHADGNPQSPWLPVHTPIGSIQEDGDDGDDDDENDNGGEWTWQAYKYDQEDVDDETNKE